MKSAISYNPQNSPKKQRGRPRQFVHEEAVSRALGLFWMQGYEGTSISELSETLQMNRPSMYASLGNKETLFNLALNYYLKHHLHFFEEAVSKSTLTEVVDTLWMGEISMLSQFETPRGCLITQAALSCGKGALPIKALLISKRNIMEAILTKRIELANLKRGFGVKPAAETLAKAIMTIYEGISIQAMSGSSKAELINIADLSKKILS